MNGETAGHAEVAVTSSGGTDHADVAVNSSTDRGWPTVAQSALDNPVVLMMVAGLLAALVMLIWFIVVTAIMGGDTIGPRAITVLDELLGAVPRRTIPDTQDGTPSSIPPPAQAGDEQGG